METQNQKEKVIKIVLTGGHAATVGIATIEELKKHFNTHKLEISWIGSKTALEGSKVTTLEYKIYPDIGVKFYSVEAGKIQTKFTRYTIPSILKIPIGFIQTFFLILSIRPKVVLSFGGYTSFPVVFWSWLFRIPVILHEQTTVAGRATMAASFFAKKVALARIESRKFFPQEKIVVVGNPVIENITRVQHKLKLGSQPTILVMGGSRGSQFINEEVIKVLPFLTKKYNLIHITGESDYEKYKEYSSKNYKVLSFVDPREMYKYYEASDLIIGRSGANTVSEILITKRPAILIPLPRTFMAEQVRNAEYAEKYGLAKKMLETEVNSNSLQNEISNILTNWNKIVSGVKEKVSPDLGAAERLVNLLVENI